MPEPVKPPPLSVDCITCGTKMELIAVEPDKHRNVYACRCINEHLQELSIPKQ